ncbi:MAG: hypothetical protein LBV15_04730 [Planctomycetota bacterium]|jgi:hypothetical protein|nr:hypothetical protein [Planctomycetota bacterium]
MPDIAGHRFSSQGFPAAAPLRGKLPAFIAGVLLASSASVFQARACGLNWRPPGTYFEHCDDEGYVLLTEKLGDLSIPGEDSAVPLWMWFSSRNTVPSPYMGLWRIGLLDMSLAQTGEKEFRLVNPGGEETLLSYDRKKNLLDGFGWKGEVAGDRARLAASCGWKVEFDKGRPARMATPGGKVLAFTYADGLVSGVTCDGKPLVTVGSPAGAALDITVNGKKLTLARTGQPVVRWERNAPVARETARSLAGITGEDGRGSGRGYTYPLDGKGRPMVTVSAGDGRDAFTLAFDPQTRKLLRCGDWTYIKARDRKTRWSPVELVRTNALAGIESVYRDIGGGVDITRKGKVKRSEYRFTSGPAAGKVRRIEDTEDGKVTHFQKYAYDEKGRPIRGEEDADRLRFEYDDKAGTTAAWRNDDLLWRKFMDVKGRTVKVEYPDKELRLAYRDDKAAHPSKAELVKGRKSVAVQLDGEGLVKAETAVFRGI